MRSLVLIGHGSHLSGEAARPLHRVAETLRADGLFDEVIEGYWKEEPSLRQVLRTVGGSDVTVVPMFLTRGYLTETVLPRELGLGHQGPVPLPGVVRMLGGRRVRYTQPYGLHRAMREVMLARVREVLPELESGEAAGTALIVLAQGPGRRSGASPHAAEVHADALREEGLFGEVHTLFLEQAAELGAWQLQARRVVVLPFLAAEDQRVREVVRCLAEGGPGAERTVRCAAAVGTHPGISEVVMQLALADTEGRGGDWHPAHAETWTALRNRARQGLRLGEVLITPHSGLYELRHVLDEGRSNTELRPYVSAEGLRDVIRFDDGGAYRPVLTFRTLPRGWRAVLTEEDLRLGLHFIYPAVVEESYAHQHYNLHCTPWPSTARRQTGRYSRVQRADPQQVEAFARRLCAPCLRTRLWCDEPLTQTFFAGVPGGMPCAEACNYFVAALSLELSRQGNLAAEKEASQTAGAGPQGG